MPYVKLQPNCTAIRKALATLLLLAVANLSSSCHYYKVKRERSPEATQATKLLQQPRKYYILHSDGQAWHMTGITISETAQTLSGTLEPLPPGHQHQESLPTHHPPHPSNKYYRYKPYRDTPYYDVHIYTNATPGTDAQSATIAFSSVQRIDVYDKAIGHTVLSYTFGILGVVAGFVVVIGIIALATKSSCPFAYVQDTSGAWQFSGELYGGAIYAPLERDDYMPLPHLATTGGKASIRLSNELQERQYTDVANVVSILHPAGTLALLDAEGHPHTIAAPHSPLPIQEGGTDDAPLLEARDGRSLIFDRGTDEDGTVSSAVLHFEKPEGARQGKLVLRAKNSFWLDYAFGKFTECFGSYYNTFAAQQKTAPAAEQKRWSRAQHIPLSVAMQTREGWKEIANIETPGPLAARDYVIPIDLSNATDGNLKVRLQSGTMFWEVDYAAMDFTPDTIMNVSEQAPGFAIDEEGKDVRPELMACDGQYLAQLSPGTAATLKYQLPEAPAGMKQSFFLHSRGYYEYIRHFRHVPNVAQLLSFKKDGAFTRFSKGRYEQFAGRADLFTTAFKTR